MLLEKVIDKSVPVVSADRSRCLRMRFDRDTCAQCVEQCRKGAIEIDDDVRIRTDSCTNCMLCAAACPSDVFTISGFDFSSLVGKLLRLPSSVFSPVLGCAARTDADCHVRSACFGFLSEAHMLALFTIMRKPVQLDMTGCKECKNGFTSAILEERLAAIGEITGPAISGKIRLITNRDELDFHDIVYGRRGFFSALKTLTFNQAAGLLREDETAGYTEAYTAKKLPGKRELLNRTVKVLPEDKARAVLERYYFTARAGEACNNCFACVGMCPTGALTIAEGAKGRELRFSSASCSGCGLCENFCLTGALVVERGFAGREPDKPMPVKTEPSIRSESETYESGIQSSSG